MATTLAERMSKFSGSPTSALIAKVAELKQQGKDIISLNVGEPDFGTPDYIKVAGMKAIADNFTKYTPGNGILELRQEIVKKLKQDNGIEYGLNEITTSVGAKQAIASAMMVIAGPGDEVILPIPCWVSYTEMIRLAGATPVFVPVRPDNYELDLKAIEDAITPRTKAIIICTPNNPTGAVYSEESLRKLAELAVKHDFFIVADEIYEKLVYDGAKHFSVASISQEVKERTVTVNGFSKAYAMTGWRIGYAAARPDVIKGIMAVQSQTTSATSSISQKAAAAALRGPQHDMEVMVEEFKCRKDYVVKRLNGIPGIVCPDVKGAFYVYPDVQAYLGKSFGDRRIETAVDLCQYLLDEALVSTVPGEAYNVPGKIRISYSNSMENLEKALDRVEKALEALHYWQGQAAGLGPMYLDYAGGWQSMAEHCGLVCQIAVLLVTAALCRFCSEENRARTDQLVLSSEKGKTTAFWARCAAGVSFAVGIALVFSALQMALCCALYGMDGFAAPLQLWVEGSFSALHVSMGQFVLILLGLLVLACGMAAVFVMLLSELFGTAIPALVVPFALSAASILELFMGNGRWMEQAASYLPFFRVSADTLQDYYLVTLGSFQLNSIQFSAVLYPLLAGLFGLLYRICHRRYQVTGR